MAPTTSSVLAVATKSIQSFQKIPPAAATAAAEIGVIAANSTLAAVVAPSTSAFSLQTIGAGTIVHVSSTTAALGVVAPTTVSTARFTGFFNETATAATEVGLVGTGASTALVALPTGGAGAIAASESLRALPTSGSSGSGSSESSSGSESGSAGNGSGSLVSSGGEGSSDTTATTTALEALPAETTASGLQQLPGSLASLSSAAAASATAVAGSASNNSTALPPFQVSAGERASAGMLAAVVVGCGTGLLGVFVL